MRTWRTQNVISAEETTYHNNKQAFNTYPWYWKFYDWCVSKIKSGASLVKRFTSFAAMKFKAAYMSLNEEVYQDIELWNRQACIIKSHPLESIIIEELMRPIAQSTLIAVEQFLGKEEAVINFHKSQLKYGFFQRIRRHLHFNFNINHSELDLHKLYNESTLTTYPIREHETYIQTVTQEQKLLKSDLPWATKDIVDPFMDRTCSYGENPQYIYPLMFPVTCMQSPTNSGPHFDACISVRILGAKYPKAQPDIWKSSNNFFPKIYLDFTEYTEDEWRDKLKPIQKKKMEKIAEQDLINPKMIDKRTSVFCKADELIPSFDKFVARFIANVSPYYMYKIGYFIDVLQNAFKNTFNGLNPFTFKTKRGLEVIYVLFACGKTSQDLDIVWNFWRSNGFKGLMVMGDDSLFHDPLLGIWETDYSKFDASQKRGEALEILPDYIEQLGYPEQARLYREMYNQPINAKQRKDKIVKGFVRGSSTNLEDKWASKEFSMRLTGEPATCLANSMVNIFAAINCWRDNKEFAKYGLQVKFRTDEFVTFLKGVFLRNIEGTYTWCRLPSFLLKFGKVLTNPTSVFKKQPYVECCEQFLHAQWLGYGELQSVNWFYAAIHKIIENLCNRKGTTPQELEYQIVTYKPQLVSNEEFDNFMLARYGITKELMLDYLQTLRNIKTLPCLYTHKLVDLLLIDYI